MCRHRAEAAATGAGGAGRLREDPVTVRTLGSGHGGKGRREGELDEARRLGEARRTRTSERRCRSFGSGQPPPHGQRTVRTASWPPGPRDPAQGTIRLTAWRRGTRPLGSSELEDGAHLAPQTWRVGRAWASFRRTRQREHWTADPSVGSGNTPETRSRNRCLDSEPHERRASPRGRGRESGSNPSRRLEPRGRNVPGEANLGEADLTAESLKGRKQPQEGQSRAFGSGTGFAGGSWKRAKPGGGAAVFGPWQAGEWKTSWPWKRRGGSGKPMRRYALQ